MDTPTDDAQYAKTPSLSTQEGAKKKRSTRKKAETKPPKADSEVVEVNPEINQDLDSDLMHYTYKLEHELAATKKKLKAQRNKFRQLIHSLAKHIDAKGITSHLVEEYVQSMNPHLANDIDSESDYEKLFTTHKYQVVDDLVPQQHIAKTTPNRKTATKTNSNMLKNVPTDKNGLAEESLISIPPLEDPHQQKNAQQQAKGTSGKPKKESSKKLNKEDKGDGEGESKKKKPKKHKESEDSALDVLEIPPPENKGKKDDINYMGYGDRMKTLQQPQHQQQIPQLQMPKNNHLDDGLRSLMQQVNLDPNNIMNHYLMGGASAQGLGAGISETDLAMYGKALQELMKMGVQNPGMSSDQAAQDLLNYYQRAFK